MRSAFLLPLLFLNATLDAQLPGAGDGPLEPVQWSISMMDQGEGEWDLIFRADIDEGWYVYSQ